MTSELSRMRNSSVMARITASVFKDKNVDAREIGKELNVRYVLEGSVERDQNRVRVNAQLIDGQTGAHLWADRFEENAADLFEFQNQVVGRLAGALKRQLVVAEAERAVRSNSRDVVDLTMRGRALIQGPQRPAKEQNDAAIDLFEQALKLDPNEPDALAGLALAYARSEWWRWNPGTGDAAKILALADRAIELDPNNVTAYVAKVYHLNYDDRWNEAIRTASAGLAIDPNSAALYGARSVAEGQTGRYEEYVADTEKARQLNRSNSDPDLIWGR